MEKMTENPLKILETIIDEKKKKIEENRYSKRAVRAKYYDIEKIAMLQPTFDMLKNIQQRLEILENKSKELYSFDWNLSKMSYEEAIVQLECERKQIFEDIHQFLIDFKSGVIHEYLQTPEYKEFEKKVLIIDTAIAHIMKLQKANYQNKVDEAVELKLKELCISD